MLRITPIEAGDGVTRFKVEGRLAGDVIGELSRIALDAPPGGVVVLEFAQVTFVDQSGARLLRHLRDAGVVFVDPSEFVLAMINGGQP